jgi:hypothetical protein
VGIEAMSIEEMKAELEVAGWRIVTNRTKMVFHAITPHGYFKEYLSDYGITPKQCYKKAIIEAHKVLQEQKRFEAMESLIKEFIETFQQPITEKLSADLVNANAAVAYMRLTEKAMRLMSNK